MRALITGGAGFLGSHLCEHLLARGWEVLCVDNEATGTESNIHHLVNEPRFEFVRADVCQQLHCGGDLDYVLHFASPASPPDYLRLPIETLKAGSFGTYNALRLAEEKKAKFMLASTSECYGDPEISPQSESYWGRVNSVGPRSVYDEAKRFAEALTMAFHRARGIDTRIVRIFNTYGPRMRLNDGRALPNFLYQALTGKPITVYGDGSQTRSFCYFSDLIEGICRLMQVDEHYPVNLGNPEEITILEFARRIKQLTGSQVPIVFQPLPQDDPKQRRPDISKARSLLNWDVRVSLQEGLEHTVRHFRQHLETRAAAPDSSAAR